MRRLLVILLGFVIHTAAFAAAPHEGFILTKDTAQYKGSTYSNVVDVARGISLDQAFAIAESNPNIDYFVYLKGYSMVLEVPQEVPVDHANDPFGLLTRTTFVYDSGEPSSGYCRIFHQGDTVFFKKEGKWLGSAPGLADTYSKK